MTPSIFSLIKNKNYRKLKRLTSKDIIEINNLRKKDWTYTAIARKFHIDHSSAIYWVKKLNKGKSITISWSKRMSLRKRNPCKYKKRSIIRSSKLNKKVNYYVKAFKKNSNKEKQYKEYLEMDKVLKCKKHIVPTGKNTCFLCKGMVKE
jgi:transposase-like protein